MVWSADIRLDKVRGALLGLAVGEALGEILRGQTPSAIRIRYGRLTAVPTAVSCGPLTRRVLSAIDATDLASDLRPGSATSPLTSALRAVFASPEDSPQDASDAASAGDLLAAILPLLYGTEPFVPLDSPPLIVALTEAADTTELRTAVDELAQLLVRPPPPRVAATLFANLGPATRELLLAVLATLVRPDAPSPAMIFAANLGGASDVRAGLTGALAGCHRGAICLPVSWLTQLTDRPEVYAGARQLDRALAGESP